jgi:hypothetical protein
MAKSIPIQLLRSKAFRQRPDAAFLLEGQPAVNINEFEPGLFFSDSANNLFKVGPTSVGPEAPNSGISGSGAQFLLLGAVTAASVEDGGTTYAVNDVLTVIGGSGTAATLKVTAVSAGEITSVTLLTAGSYSVFPVSPVIVSGGSGSGATFNLIGGVTSASVSFGGTNYFVGNILTLSGGTGIPAVLQVQTVSGTSVTSVSLVTPGSYTVFPVPPAGVIESSGTGGNSVGEQWLDTYNPNAPGLKVFDGVRWRGITPISNTLWVDVNGNDGNDGTSPQTAKRTIKSALALAEVGTQIRVAAGVYEEQNPLVFPYTDVSIVGADLRDTTIHLQNLNDDLFHVLNGCYVQNFSFTGVVNRVEDPPGSEITIQKWGIMSFKPGVPDINTPGSPLYITQSPYVQNCTNFVTNSIGLNVDGSLAGGLRSMVLDSFTQYNPDGLGVKVYNRGYCQVVSMFTICADKSVLAETGGLVSVTNSNSDFGNYGMYADGVGPLEQSGTLVSGGSTLNNSVFSLQGLTTDQVPYVGQVITVGELFYNVSGFEIGNKGSGFTSPPTVTVSIGSGPNAIAAQGIAEIKNGQLDKIELASSGQNYTDSDTIVVTITGGGGVGATATAVKNPVYFTVAEVTQTFTGEGGTVSIAIQENLTYDPFDSVHIPQPPVVNFWRVSRIIANSHCMEYVGSGTDINTAVPFTGGTAIQANEVIQVNGGRVAITSTDQLGDFRVGEDLVINQNTGTISGQAFRKSILSIVIPYILALS